MLHSIAVELQSSERKRSRTGRISSGKRAGPGWRRRSCSAGRWCSQRRMPRRSAHGGEGGSKKRIGQSADGAGNVSWISPWFRLKELTCHLKG